MVSHCYPITETPITSHNRLCWVNFLFVDGEPPHFCCFISRARGGNLRSGKLLIPFTRLPAMANATDGEWTIQSGGFNQQIYLILKTRIFVRSDKSSTTSRSWPDLPFFLHQGSQEWFLPRSKSFILFKNRLLHPRNKLIWDVLPQIPRRNVEHHLRDVPPRSTSRSINVAKHHVRASANPSHPTPPHSTPPETLTYVGKTARKHAVPMGIAFRKNARFQPEPPTKLWELSSPSNMNKPRIIASSHLTTSLFTQLWDYLSSYGCRFQLPLGYGGLKWGSEVIFTS